MRNPKINKPNHKNKKKENKESSHKNSMHQEYIFDSPYNQLYFQNFVMFLEELIKKEFPQKFDIVENSCSEFELRIDAEL